MRKVSQRTEGYIYLGIATLSAVISVYTIYVSKVIFDSIIYSLLEGVKNAKFDAEFPFTNVSMWSGVFGGIILCVLCSIKHSALYYNPDSHLSQAGVLVYNISWVFKIIICIFGITFICFLGCSYWLPDFYWGKNVGGYIGYALFIPMIGVVFGAMFSMLILLGIEGAKKFWLMYQSVCSNNSSYES